MEISFILDQIVSWCQKFYADQIAPNLCGGRIFGVMIIGMLPLSPLFYFVTRLHYFYCIVSHCLERQNPL